MSIKLFTCEGGEIILPNIELVLVSREDGGNLVVNPPREVWERSELTAEELKLWSFLVAAAGKVMLDVLPQLKNGCLNYWEAGNWALNDQAKPHGLKKTAKEYRKVHLHLLGRNPESLHPSMKWGEAPKFPDFSDRFDWAKDHQRLTPEECQKIIEQTAHRLQAHYQIRGEQIDAWGICEGCDYPTVVKNTEAKTLCEECAIAP
jgi:hypothetical protein